MGREHNPEITAIDATIGKRIHELRLSMGMSRIQLAEQIGVTHQQLEKYEKGKNRISAGRLLFISNALRKNPSYFFRDIAEDETTMPGTHQRLCIEVSRNFMKIDNPEHRVAVSTLVKSLSGQQAA